MGTRGSKGFTLLEVMLAVAITGMLLVTIIEMVNHNLSIVDRYQTISIATMLGKDKIQELQAAPQKAEGRFDAPYSDYRWQSDIINSPLPAFNLLSLTVSSGRESSTLKVFVPK